MLNGFFQCRSSLLSPILLHFSFPKMLPRQWLLQNPLFQHAALRTYCSCRAGAASKLLLYSCQLLTVQMTEGENQTSMWTSVPFSNLRNSVERGIGHKYFSLPFRLGASWSWALQLMLFCDQRELSFKVSTQSLCCCMLSFTDGESAPCVSQLICRAQHSVPHITAN